jgi:hypothetical protein
MIDCTSSLSKLGTIASSHGYNYASSTETKELWSRWSQIFQNSEPLLCLTVRECRIYKEDCSTDLSLETNIKIGTSSPWPVSYVQNVKAGWIETFCYQCWNKAQYINSKFSVNLRKDCSTHLVTAQNQKESELILSFSDSIETISQGWSEIFQNLDPITCGPITSCSLFQEDCQT